MGQCLVSMSINNPKRKLSEHRTLSHCLVARYNSLFGYTDPMPQKWLPWI